MVNVMNTLLANLSKPSGLWPTLFEWFEGFVGNYGWTIVLFTLAVKLIVSPFDFYNRYSTRKNTLIQKRLAGQVQKINEKYQNKKEEANRQVSALYKKEGYNMIGSCVFMLINMIVTLVIFFTFFNALRSISAYKMLDQYSTLESTYTSTLAETGKIEDAEQKTLESFLDINKNNKWLWVENIWRNDSKVNSVPSYGDLVKAAKNSGEDQYIEYLNSVDENTYNSVTKSIQSENKDWNGYYILAILVLLSTFLTQFVSEKMNDSKTKNNNPVNDQTQNTMKIMKLVLPIVMLIFVVTNTASFGIYILIGNLFGILTNLLFGIIVNKMTKGEEEKYLAYVEKESLKAVKKQKPKMVNYKNLGDRL